MKRLISFGLLALVFTLAAAACRQAQATVIDFAGIPDGTPVSDGNPYAGILVMEARDGWIENLPDPPYGVVHWLPLPIHGEAIETRLLATLWPIPPGWFQGMTEIRGTFLQPVIDVSFEAWSWRLGSYSYSGVNDAGDTVTGGGRVQDPPYSGEPVQPISLTLPDGYHLTQFELSNSDHGGSHFFLHLDNIRFEFPSESVPDPGQTRLMLAISFLALAALRRSGR